MAEFKRVVSYIHLYENMRKGKNIGFVRTDVHDGICRIEVHVNGVYTNGKEMCEIYSLRNGGKGCFVGDFPVEHQTGACHLKRNENQVDDQGSRIQELEGFAFKLSEDRLALSLFQGKEPPFEKVVLAGRVYGQNGITEETVPSEMKETEPQEIHSQPEPEQTAFVPDISGENLIQEPETAEIANRSEEPGSVPDADAPQEDTPEAREDASDLPVITPFEDVTKYVFYKVSPDHLANLASEYEIMQHNSFLLHGYYNYQYLIMGQKEGDRWILGVPGVYHDREQMMASMFGFPEFKGARKGKVTSGTFGYYLKEVRVDIHSWNVSPRHAETQNSHI